MIFLKKLFRRAAVSDRQSGQVTVWMALAFLVFLSLYLVCLESVWKQLQRQQSEQASEAAVFSLFSEFEPHLLERYDLFYLDTSFGTGRERMDELCSHLWNFMENNITDRSGGSLYGLELKGVDLKNPVRATDGRGAVFYRQAVQVMKEKRGASLAEDWLLQDMVEASAEEDSARFQEDCEAYEGSVEEYEAEEEEEELADEAYQFDGLRNSFTLSMAVPGDRSWSDKRVDLTSAPSRRVLSQGTGRADGTEDRLLQKQWFVSYLCEYLTHAQEMLPGQKKAEYLDYQLEYIIGDMASDQENLEIVVRRLLLMREGVNYVFLLSHPEFQGKAEVLADILAGFTGNPALVEGLKHLILLGWAYGESLVEVRQLLGGYELAAVKTAEDWQVPLSRLLPLMGDPGKYDVQVKKQQGIDYELCLRIFLMGESSENLAMRAMDVIEGEWTREEGSENMHLDHCVEQLTAQIWLDGISLERSCGYE
ncbi:MAG: hypothetical protein KH452_11495 [Clostridiales bacterium]|nr:hypothetical protein [Clostridiales bacterium]